MRRRLLEKTNKVRSLLSNWKFLKILQIRFIFCHLLSVKLTNHFFIATFGCEIYNSAILCNFLFFESLFFLFPPTSHSLIKAIDCLNLFASHVCLIIWSFLFMATNPAEATSTNKFASKSIAERSRPEGEMWNEM